ncbi:MAG: hypothetical protein IH940_07480 [Acidobacteria bacterium]|nr:hypothetical protein [Acidobacteriota bacterium]
MATGALMGLSGVVVRSVVSAQTAALALGATAAVGVAVEAGWVRQPIRGHRQVNENWLNDYRGWVYGFGFGAQLGTGLVTIVPSCAVFIAWLAALASGHVGTGVLIGFVFGFTRAAVLISAAHVDTPSELHTFHRRLVALGVRWRQLTLVTLGVGAFCWLTVGVAL